MSCVEDTESVNLSLAGGVLSADVLISAEGGNALVQAADGLFVSGGFPSGFGGFTYAPALPAGWAFCDGSAISRAGNPALFSAIGTTYGAGDGTTTFNLPDARDRAQVGAGNNTTLGQNDGNTAANRHQLRHRHTVVDPTHVHTGNAFNHSYGTGAPTSSTNDFASTPNNPGAYTTNAGATGISVQASATDPLDTPGYIGVNNLIHL